MIDEFGYEKVTGKEAFKLMVALCACFTVVVGGIVGLALGVIT